MPKSQKLFCNCFGYVAIISSAVFITLLPVLLRSPLPHATPRFQADFLGLLLIFMREMILVAPPVVAVVNGMAWWSLRNGAPSARRWALAASLSSVVLSAPFLVADAVIVQYSLTGAVGFTGVLVLFLILFSLGFAGLAAFGKRDAMLLADPDLPRVTTGGKQLVALSGSL